jgi:hypothetical protein
MGVFGTSSTLPQWSWARSAVIEAGNRPRRVPMRIGVEGMGFRVGERLSGRDDREQEKGRNADKKGERAGRAVDGVNDR